MGIGGVKGKVKVKGDEVQEEDDDGLGNFGKSGKKEKLKKKMKGTVASSGTATRLRGKGRQGKSQMSSRSTRDMADDELDDEPVLGESRIKNEDAEYASLPFTAMMAEDDTPCPTPRNAKVWGSTPWMFDEEDGEEAETERDDCNGTVRIPPSVEEVPSKILRPSTLPLLSSSSFSTKEDDTPTSTKRSKTSHQEKSSPGVITSTATFPKNISSSSSSTPTTYSTMLSPPNPSSSATTTTTIQEKEELDKQQDPNANSHSNDLFVSPFWETAQAETISTSTGEVSSSVKMMKKKMKEKEKKRSYHIVDVDAAYCLRSNKKVKRSNDDDDDDVGGGSSSSSKVGGRGTRKKRIPLAVLEDYPVGQ